MFMIGIIYFIDHKANFRVTDWFGFVLIILVVIWGIILLKRQTMAVAELKNLQRAIILALIVIIPNMNGDSWLLFGIPAALTISAYIYICITHKMPLFHIYLFG